VAAHRFPKPYSRLRIISATTRAGFAFDVDNPASSRVLEKAGYAAERPLLFRLFSRDDSVRIDLADSMVYPVGNVKISIRISKGSILDNVK